jgi:hypothetical protein
VSSPRPLVVSRVPARFREKEIQGMADWKKLAAAAILADGRIDDAEVKLLRKELLADKKIDKQEVSFLIELRNEAQKKAKARKAKVNPAFEKFFFDAIAMNVLADKTIDKAEAAWLRKMLYADKKIDENEKRFLRRLQKEAKKTSPAFDALCKECLK